MADRQLSTFTTLFSLLRCSIAQRMIDDGLGSVTVLSRYLIDQPSTAGCDAPVQAAHIASQTTRAPVRRSALCPHPLCLTQMVAPFVSDTDGYAARLRSADDVGVQIGCVAWQS